MARNYQPVDERPPKPIYTLDIETDPFEKGKMVYPFCLGFYDGTSFKSTWGKNCIAEMREYIKKMPEGIIYLHNGGRFDIFYLMDWLSGKAMIINGRIVKALMKTGSGEHEVRDSYAIMPFALKTSGKKDEIDYNKMKKAVREKHRTEILSYLKQDCVGLWELCTAFCERFGPQLTIGTTSMKELKKIHTFEVLDERTDKEIRETYYYGGRVQCFEKGVMDRQFKVFDVNSMYPHAMQSFKHPMGDRQSPTKKIGRNTFFILAEGKNYGAFPCRGPKGGLRFDVTEGTFGVSIHEWRAAISLGLFEPTKIIRCDNFERSGTFSDFVSYFYGERNAAKIMGNDTLALFYKYILNSAYGKFAQNPANYFDYKIAPDYEDHRSFKPDGTTDEKGWTVHEADPRFNLIIWKRPSDSFIRHNVATAASITGAARSILMRAIAHSKNPIYCDTDSIICEELEGVEIDDTQLGAWKLEKIGNRAAVAGKKLYAIFSDTCPVCQSRSFDIYDGKCRVPATRSKWHTNGGCVKHANKGARISPLEILAAAQGATIQFESEVPTFKWDGSYRFINRKVRMT